MDGTLDFDCYSLGSNNLDNLRPSQSIFVKLSWDVKANYDQYLHLQWPRSKHRKFRILPLSEIIERGQNPKFVKYGHV